MFVIECFVPDLARFDHDQRVQARSVTEDSAIIEVSVHDKVQQRVTTQMITLNGQRMHLRPVAIRYSWPTELDLMAGLAGLRLTERHAAPESGVLAKAASGALDHLAMVRVVNLARAIEALKQVKVPEGVNPVVMNYGRGPRTAHLFGSKEPVRRGGVVFRHPNAFA